MLYLKLFHGRPTLAAELDDWGYDGAYYGDWSAFTESELTEEMRARVVPFCARKATVPEEEQATVTCCLCGEQRLASTAHRHQDTWIGDECCWDERLRSSE